MRVLLVEDHADTAEVMSRLLTAREHHVTAVRTAHAAKDLLGSGAFDVMVCDFQLPDGRGWELAEVAAHHRVPSIALTALARNADTDRRANAGFAAYLTKPCGLDQLADAMLRVTTRTDPVNPR